MIRKKGPSGGKNSPQSQPKRRAEGFGKLVTKKEKESCRVTGSFSARSGSTPGSPDMR